MRSRSASLTAAPAVLLTAGGPVACASARRGAATGTVRHRRGTTGAPVHPRRALDLDPGERDGARAVGPRPVGAVTAPVEQGPPSCPPDEVVGLATAGEPGLHDEHPERRPRTARPLLAAVDGDPVTAVPAASPPAA